MENLRVRRAGFAYRRPHNIFLERYKSLCPQTWPNWNGDARDGVQTLVKHLQLNPEEYRCVAGGDKLSEWPARGAAYLSQRASLPLTTRAPASLSFA